jgi:hypothetical protein
MLALTHRIVQPFSPVRAASLRGVLGSAYHGLPELLPTAWRRARPQVAAP